MVTNVVWRHHLRHIPLGPLSNEPQIFLTLLESRDSVFTNILKWPCGFIYIHIDLHVHYVGLSIYALIKCPYLRVSGRVYFSHHTGVGYWLTLPFCHAESPWLMWHSHCPHSPQPYTLLSDWLREEDTPLLAELSAPWSKTYKKLFSLWNRICNNEQCFV